MVENVLVGWARFNECCGSVGGQYVVPEMGQIARNVKAQQAFTNNAHMMKTGHHLTVVLGHCVSGQILCASFGKQLKLGFYP